jgi:hypothetical protein
MIMSDYFGDIRDSFEQIYETSASFVRLPSTEVCAGAHVRFNLNLGHEPSMQQFSILCYAYEDSYEWSELPLVFDSRLPEGTLRWQHGERVVAELPMERALGEFDEGCDSLLTSK